jgi:hypothetical protein
MIMPVFLRGVAQSLLLVQRRPVSSPSLLRYSRQYSRGLDHFSSSDDSVDDIDWNALLAEAKDGQQVANLDFIDASRLMDQLRDQGEVDFLHELDDFDDEDEDAFNTEDLVDRAWRDHNLLPQAQPLLSWNTNLGDGGKSSVEHVVERVRKDGVVRINGVLSSATAAELRSFILDLLDGAESAAKDRTQSVDQALFSSVLSPSDHCVTLDAPTTRWDMRLPLTGIVEQAAREVLGGPENGPLSLLGNSMEALTGGPSQDGGAEIWELAALVSKPGSAPQIVHSDTEEGSTAPCLFTAFVALQPVARERGPTRFLKGTHVPSAHAAFREGRHAEDFLPKSTVLEALLDTGDCSLYDGRLLHCGGPNLHAPTQRGEARSNNVERKVGDEEEDGHSNTRVLFYVTVRHRDANAEELSNSAAHSIRPEYSGQLQLASFFPSSRT